MSKITGRPNEPLELLVGSKAVNALSKRMIVSTKREGLEEIVEFSKGKFVSYKKKQISTEISGTTVEFYPDFTIFETNNFNFEAIQKMVREFSFLCQGLTFIIIQENGEKTEYLSNNGLSDYMDYLTPKKNYLIPPIHFTLSEGSFQLEVALSYNASYSTTIRLYTNNIPQEKGTHLTGFKTAFTQTFNTFAREKKWLKDKDDNFTGADLEEGQVLILNFKMIDPVFKGQNKEELSSSEGRTYVQRLATAGLKKYFSENEKDIKVIAEKALKARKAREAAQKAREAARQPKEKKKQFLNLPTKLVDCWSKDRQKCELLICEGDSAAGGLVEGRDAEFAAIFPIRGKIISALKNSDEKVFANQEVNNLIKALGLDIDVKTQKLIYDIKKLRYGKVLLAADADSDGASIRNLLLELLWWLCPELILQGHVYTTRPPLFRITTKKNEYIFLKDEDALEAYKKQHSGEKYLINRNKG